MAAIDQIRVAGEAASEGAAHAARSTPGDAAARRTLRAQVARLEREISALVVASYPRLDPGPRLPSLGGPRRLSLGELERVRDALAGRLTVLRAAAAEQRARQSAAARELEEMLADPPAHRWKRLTNADLGLPGCTTYHVRPRAGLLGMLMGWWQVKISGGCP
jgi:hypothetical protein